MRQGSLFYLAVGLLIIGGSLPLIFEKVKPNRWFGLRVEKTLSDPHIWYRANKTLGYDLLIAGAVIFVIAGVTIVIDFYYQNMPTSKINLAVFVSALVVAVAHSLFALSRLHPRG